MRKRLIAEAAILHLEANRAESRLSKLAAKLDEAQAVIVGRQRECQKSGDVTGYREAVAEEAAVTGAYRRVNEALGRMNYGQAR